ncbi:MAG: GAF domain-containing protein [Myxococcales bacterium]|nr:GAF domain-containing protein [Myxococcales bacterium]
MSSEYGQQPLRVARHAVLAELAVELTRALEADDPGDARGLVERGVTRVKWVLEFDRCTLALPEEPVSSDGSTGAPAGSASYSLSTLHEADDDADVVERAGIPLSDGIAGLVLRERKICLFEHPRTRVDADALTLVDTELRDDAVTGVIAAPLLGRGGAPLAALVFASRAAAGFSADDARYVAAVAQQLALVLERQALERRLRKAERAAAEQGAARSHAEQVAASAEAQRSEFENKRVSELLKSNAKLREEIEILARAKAELRQAKNAADAASRAKSAFLVNMSHELRNTLNAIIGYGEMLQEQAADEGYEDIIPDLGRICMSGQYLMSTIRDIIDMSKIEGGRVNLTLETFPVASLVQEVAAAVEPLIEQRGNKLDVQVDDELGSMRADLGKVRQVLFNVLMASSRLTREGEISVSVYRDMFRGRARFVFMIKDNGLGMTESQIMKTFATFSSDADASAAAGEPEGAANLGLAISRYFSEMMGGQVIVDSRVGLGSSFTIRLPANMSPV